MTKLVSQYAKVTGLTIDKPNVKEQFYPTSFDRYITLQTGSGQGPKNYSYFQEVVALVKPILDANRITIVHLGAKEDPPINGVYDLRGKTTILQSNYLIKRTLAHVGNDSWLAHCAGWNFRPLVALYGSTSISAHSPFWYDPATTVLLESHRWGGRPTYSAGENPKSIDTIPPEQVANALLRLLGIKDQFAHQTRFVGLLYTTTVIDLVPDSFPGAEFMPGAPINVRMDRMHVPEVLAGLLETGRRVNIFTKAPIDINLLNAHRGQVLSYNHELDAGADEKSLPTLEYVDLIRAVCPHYAFFTREQDAAKVSALRFRYFDHVTVEQVKDLTKEEYLGAAMAYLNWKGDEKRVDLERETRQTGGVLRFKTNKFVLGGGSAFLSYAHLAANQPTQSLQANEADVIDSPDLWRDINHMMVTWTPGTAS
jgi:hypothetical protein